MKPIIIDKNCNYQDKIYLKKGKEIVPNRENFEMIVKLNEKGFLVNPLTFDEIVEIKENINKPKFKEEED